MTLITAMRNLDRKSVNESSRELRRSAAAVALDAVKKAFQDLSSGWTAPLFSLCSGEGVTNRLLRHRHLGPVERSGFTWGRIMYCRKREMLWPWERESRKFYKRFTSTPVIAVSVS